MSKFKRFGCIFLAISFAAGWGCLCGDELPSQAANNRLDLVKVFKGAPFIYTVQFAMSLFSLVLWLYSMMTLKLSDMMPMAFISQLREQLAEKRFESALISCQKEGTFAANIIASGLAARRHGSQVMIEAMQLEGKRAGMNLWQRISLLNDVVVIAPMLGLLGTVLGLFFAFYDNSRSAESLISIFDGLGVAIGTTVAGLVVAITAMFFHTSLKFRITFLLNTIENEALSLVNMVELDQAPGKTFTQNS